MDAFYASVEQHDDPSLVGKPVIVGGASRRGVVAAASYEVRAFGVHSAMSMVEALRRCPHAVVLSGRHGRYAEVSGQVFAVFRRFTPAVESLSLDEAFLDVTASRALFGDGEAIARRIKDEIRAETGLAASAGVAPSKFIAKIASDLRKPDALVVVRPGEEQAFLAPLPVERMWGVGARSAERLRAHGLSTLGDLAAAPERTLEALLGSWGPEVRRLARGEDDREVVPDRAAKSVGAEVTFEEDLVERSAIERELLAQSARVAARLFEASVAGSVVTVKLKTADRDPRALRGYPVQSRQLRMPEPVDDTDAIFAAARTLLDRFDLAGRRVRLTGVAVSDLEPAGARPLLLPDEAREKRRRVEELSAAVSARFGEGALTRAALVERKKPGP